MTLSTGPEQGGRKPDPLIGATLDDRYRLTHKIGEGGMGTVYEANHVVLGKRVAVKVLREKYVDRPEVAQRLVQEARLASSIRHEHIVDIADSGSTNDGRTFVVMELLDGRSLSELIRAEGPVPELRADRDRASGGVRAGRRARPPHRPPRHQPGEHFSRRPRGAGLRQGGRLRHLQVAARGRGAGAGVAAAHPHRHGPGNAALHVARAGARRRGSRSPHRHLRAGRDSLRVPDRRGAVSRHQLQRHHRPGGQSRGDPAAEAAARAAHLRGGRARGGQEHGQVARRSLSDDGGARGRPRACHRGRRRRGAHARAARARGAAAVAGAADRRRGRRPWWWPA